MPAKILDGKWLSKQVHAAVKVEVDRVRAEIGRAPGLGV
ncbi:MAG: bifunctional methylenetetrahydrofolate dehydrogenase/methenyltetrahydrofolate cyclohydrolase, partial [Proteobacteria bacterium]